MLIAVKVCQKLRKFEEVRKIMHKYLKVCKITITQKHAENCESMHKCSKNM